MMSDTMTLAAVAAKDRATIRAILNPLRDRLRTAKEVLATHQSTVGMVGFGAYDDDEYQKQQRRYERESAAAAATIAALEHTIHQITNVFGLPVVQHAIEEGERRIGSLPYVD